MAASITAHLQIFKRPQLLHFSTDLDETGIKIHGLLISFILNMVIIRVAVPFNENGESKCIHHAYIWKDRAFICTCNLKLFQNALL